MFPDEHLFKNVRLKKDVPLKEVLVSEKSGV